MKITDYAILFLGIILSFCVIYEFKDQMAFKKIICDEEINNSANYPMSVSYSISWAWSVKKTDGTIQNYSEVDLDYYNRVLLGNSSFKLIFKSTEECDALIAAFKQ